MIAGLERKALHALSVQLGDGTPLDCPPLRSPAFLVRRHDVNEGMRIAVIKLYKLALNRHRLVFIVGGGEGVVGIGRPRARERQHQQKHPALHLRSPPGNGPFASLRLL